MKRISTDIFAKFFFLISAMSLSGFSAMSQESVARQWNEILLFSIRNDQARPTVHARNLFHTSIAMYDAWAVFDDEADTYFLGKTHGNFTCPFDGIAAPEDVKTAQETAMSFAMYRLILHRFQLIEEIIPLFTAINEQMASLGLNPAMTSIDYSDGDPGKLGNYLAHQIIQFGFQDGSNEQEDYGNLYYFPVNDTLRIFDQYANPNMTDPFRWQPLGIDGFIDQAGNEIGEAPPFLSPEWGNVTPFSLREDQVTEYERDGDIYRVFLDPPAELLPTELDIVNTVLEDNYYKWGHQMVSVWQGHLDPADTTMWDISPGAMGNNTWLPETVAEFPLYYRFFDGGTNFSDGHPVNPVTGMPYEPNIVKRGDYARILAEFWADGPDSETPPGHWYTIMNYVTDHPMFEKKWGGEGDVLDDLEWDVKLYFALGGALHDAAVAAWSIKGWYDYVRPVSALRYMAGKGQASDPDLPNYDPEGFILIPDHVELVMPGDPLAGDEDEFLYHVKLKTWKGHDSLYIPDPEVDHAGVDWILAGYWFPYQRPSFVTPPFAGYISGHSTYSRTAAELVTLITGSQYFPGGMGVFVAEKDEYLEFENGPSETVVLQWATYQDASDQCSLSRMWGGIHPPVDDIPGRLIGMELGPQAYEYATGYMTDGGPKVADVTYSASVVNDAVALSGFSITVQYNKDMDQESAPVIEFVGSPQASADFMVADGEWIDSHTYQQNYDVVDGDSEYLVLHVRVKDALGENGKKQQTWIGNGFFVDTKNPTVVDASLNHTFITDAQVGQGQLVFELEFDEAMNQDVFPTFSYVGNDSQNSLVFNPSLSQWQGNVCVKVFDVIDQNVEVNEIFIHFEMAMDGNMNVQVPYSHYEAIAIDTKNPAVTILSANDYLITNANVGEAGFVLVAIFDEAMNTQSAPGFSFPDADVSAVLTPNPSGSEWLNAFTYIASFDVAAGGVIIENIDVEVSGATDIPGNPSVVVVFEDFFSIDQVTSVAELQTSGTLSVFPNPVTVGQELNLTWPASVGAHTVFVANSNGQVVFSRGLADVSGHRFGIPTAKFATGTYFVGVITPEGHLTTRVIVKK